MTPGVAIQDCGAPLDQITVRRFQVPADRSTTGEPMHAVALHCVSNGEVTLVELCTAHARTLAAFILNAADDG